MTDYQAGRKEVKRAALLSVFAAIALTLTKLVIGVVTGSLGIISEALHSGLDLSAAGITYVAVRRASEGPDQDHPYGHGKVENFAALVETIILWITSIWIVSEAIHRIESGVVMEPSLIGILVMVFSLIVDYERSKKLYSVAEEHGSQALEADALHFHTDMISSGVVIIGLAFVWIGIPIADPIAAIGVAIVIIVISYRLGRRSYDALVDTAPPGIQQRVRNICMQIPGVLDCKRVRCRTSGPEIFIDVVAVVNDNLDMTEASRIATRIEGELSNIEQNVDVVVQMIPRENDNIEHVDRSVYEELKSIVSSNPDVIGMHNAKIMILPNGVHIAADIELDDRFTLEHAHEVSRLLEKQVRERVSEVRQIRFHLESVANDILAEDITENHTDLVDVVRRIVEEQSPATNCHNVIVTSDELGIIVSLDCKIEGSISLRESHKIADQIEVLIKKSIPDVSDVIVHMEPL